MVRTLMLAAVALAAFGAPAFAAPPPIRDSVAICDPNQNPSSISCLSITNGGFATAPAAGSQGTSSANPTYTAASTPSYAILPAGQTSGSAFTPQAMGYAIALPNSAGFGTNNPITITDTANNGVPRSTTYTGPQSVPPVLCPSAGDVITATSTNGSQTQAVMLNANPGASCPNISVNVGSATTDGSTTQTTGGMAQALFGGVKPAHGWKASTTGTQNCYVSDATATPSASTPGSQTVFGGGGQYSTEVGQLPAGPVYVTCPLTGQPISAQAW